MRGVPQRTVRGPLLFVIFIDIDNIDNGIVSKVSKSADIENCKEDLRRVYEWAKERQILFNFQNY